jgi:hypothetical protein
MYERLKRLYQEQRLNEDGLNAAVLKGWITEAQAEEIKNGDAANKIEE